MTTFIQSQIQFKNNIFTIGLSCVLGFGVTTFYNVIINNKLNKLIADNERKYNILLEKYDQLNNKIKFLNYEKELVFEKKHYYNNKKIETIDIYHNNNDNNNDDNNNDDDNNDDNNNNNDNNNDDNNNDDHDEFIDDLIETYKIISIEKEL